MFIKNLKIVFKICQINDTFNNIVILVGFSFKIKNTYFNLNLNF